MSSATEEYLVSSVMTAPPERLHLLVVEAAVRYARIGREAVIEKKFDRAIASLSKARECVTELISGIRTDPNPELADRLKGLFLFCHGAILKGDLEHNPDQIADAIKILEMHRDTWRELIARLAGQPAVTAPPSPVGEATATPSVTRPAFATSAPPIESGGIDFTT